MGNNLPCFYKKVQPITAINYVQSYYNSTISQQIIKHRLWYIVNWYFTYFNNIAILLIWLIAKYPDIKIIHIDHIGLSLTCNYGTFNWLDVPLTFYF